MTQNKTSPPCALCGHEPPHGFAQAWWNDEQVYLCHADDHSCYHLWTVWGVRRIPADPVLIAGPPADVWAKYAPKVTT